MNVKKLLNALFTLKNINLYDNIASIVNIKDYKQNIYKYISKENISLHDFILICDYLNIDINLQIDDNTTIDIHTLID